MKEAMWGLGMLVICLFGLVLVNLFGNITITDQMNYITMKNSVEAAMYDSLDIAHYRAGFCLCTNNEKTDGKWSFNSNSEYELSDIQYTNNVSECKSNNYNKCEILYGEYRINPESFEKILKERFMEMITNNKKYEIKVTDIIEYPPKVSVVVTSTDDEFSPTEKNGGGYDIVNKIDAILENDKVVVSGPNKQLDIITDPPISTSGGTTSGNYDKNVKVSSTSLNVKKGATVAFNISSINAVGVVSIVSSNPNVAITDKSRTWLESDDDTVTDSKTITIIGKNAGSTQIIISMSDIVTYDTEIELNGTIKIDVIVE